MRAYITDHAIGAAPLLVAILFALFLGWLLGGCSGVTVEPCPIEDAGVSRTDDAGPTEPDAGPELPTGRIGGLVACGTLSQRAGSYCTDCAVPCPWRLPSNPADPVPTCDPVAWEQCFRAAWGANGCTELEAVLTDPSICDPEACR